MMIVSGWNHCNGELSPLGSPGSHCSRHYRMLSLYWDRSSHPRISARHIHRWQPVRVRCQESGDQQEDSVAGGGAQVLQHHQHHQDQPEAAPVSSHQLWYRDGSGDDWSVKWRVNDYQVQARCDISGHFKLTQNNTEPSKQCLSSGLWTINIAAWVCRNVLE